LISLPGEKYVPAMAPVGVEDAQTGGENY